MATNRAKSPSRRPRLSCWLSLAFALLLSAVACADAQDPPLRPREALRLAIDTYKRGDYESASVLFAQAAQRPGELDGNDRLDLEKFGTQNTNALKDRQEGSAQLHKAEEALNQGRPADAGKLLRKAEANPHLGAGDQQALKNLNARLQAATLAGAKGDPKALLAAARAALEQKDFSTADMLANAAEKAGATASWMPWADTPAKVHRDVQAARLKTPPPVVVKGPAETPEKKDTGWFPGFKSLFGKETAPVVAVSTDKPSTVPESAVFPPVPPVSVAQTPPSPNTPPPSVAPPSAPPSVPQTGLPQPDRKVLARQMLADGYKALQLGDFDTARRLAFQVKDLNVELDRTELGPDQLLHEVQKKSLAASSPKMPKTPDDSRALVKEGRLMLQKNKLNEAEVLCSQAAAVPNARWGLFEDSPEKLRSDIQKAHALRDREESVKLLAEAHKLFAAGQYDDAKKKAWQAEKLHGPYGVLDFGERPQKLVAEITKAEAAKGAAAQKPAPLLAQKKDNVPPLVADPAKVDPLIAAQAKAVALIGEARMLEQHGQLVEARQKAADAMKLGIIFRPGEDSPEAVMQLLNARCKGQIQLTLNQVTEAVAGKPGDSARLQRALADLAAARLLAVQFALDTVAIDQKAAWVQQAAAGNGFNAPAGPTPPPLNQVAFNNPIGDPKLQAGRDKLEAARLELKHGNTKGARKLAEEAWDPIYGVKNEAEMVLRDIDAEEHNQRMLTAQRSFDAGVDAFLRRDYKMAGNIFVSIDLQLLPLAQQQRLREIMATREMDPQAIVQAGQKIELKPNATDKLAGTAVAGDQGNQPIDQVRIMEKIQFDQMSQRNAQAQTTSVQLFKAGQEMKAIEVLTTQLQQLELAGLSDQAKARLSAPLEKRIQEFRIIQSGKLLAEQRKGQNKGWNKDANQVKIKNQQQQVADLIKQSGALDKEHKYKEAVALAQQAKELDPDNLAANAIIQMLVIKQRMEVLQKIKTEDEDGFLKLLDTPRGKLPTDETPFQVDQVVRDRLMNRANKVFDKIDSERKNLKERAIEYRLDQPINFGFKDTPLREAIDTISKLSGIPVFPDELALTSETISLDHTLTMDCNDMAMKSALSILLGKMRLTYIIEHDALMITTLDKAQRNFTRVVYPVTDLVIPIDDHHPSEVTDLTAVLQRSLDSQYPQKATGASPITPYGSLQQGTPVSTGSGSYKNGLGSAFGANSQSQPLDTGNMPTRNRAPGETMQDLLMDLIKSTIQPQSWKDMGGPGEIRYYPLGMALVVNQTQEVQGEVLELLAALRRLQDMEVAIEMRVVEVSESFYERIGVDFNVNIAGKANASQQNQLINGSFAPGGVINKNLSGFSPAVISGVTPAGTLTPDLGIPIGASSFNFSTPPFGGYTAPGVDGGLSVGLAFLSNIQVFMLLEAAQGDSRTNVMQAPKITVFNGQAASINIQTFTFINLGILPIQQANGQVLFQPQNTPIPVGLTLNVTPVVSADRRFVRVNMQPNITQLITTTNGIPLFPIQVQIPNLVDGPFGQQVQVGQPVTFTTFLQQPQVSSISLNTTVNVPDGGTVLLGGIKTMSEGRNEAGPPILDKIPYLDRLFRNVGWGRDAQTLMILVTPRIIINEEEEQIFLGQIPPIPRQ